jgi:FkbM family methyltransferase
MKALIKRIPFFGRLARTGWMAYTSWKNDPVRLIERSLRNRHEAFVVQIGSNDGKTGDPIHGMLRRNTSWRALFVEPVPFLYQRLRENYGNEARFCFENIAIGANHTLNPFYYLPASAREHFPELPVWFDQLGSFTRDHIAHELGRSDIEPFIAVANIPTVPLPELLSRNDVRQIDLLHIDTEGYDWMILQQLDLTRFRPTLVLFEHKHLSPAAKAASKAFLSPNYSLRDLGSDYFCKLRTSVG